MTTERKPRGFATLSQERRREIASMGGKSVPAEKRSYSQNAGLAARAGRKGVQSVNPENRSYSRDPELAAKCGAKGGRAAAKARAEAAK